MIECVGRWAKLAQRSGACQAKLIGETELPEIDLNVFCTSPYSKELFKAPSLRLLLWSSAGKAG